MVRPEIKLESVRVTFALQMLRLYTSQRGVSWFRFEELAREECGKWIRDLSYQELTKVLALLPGAGNEVNNIAVYCAEAFTAEIRLSSERLGTISTIENLSIESGNL